MTTIVYDTFETAPSDTYSGSYGSRDFFEKSSIYTTGSFLREVMGDTATSFFNTGALVDKKYLLSDYPFLKFGNKNLQKKNFNRFSIGVCKNEQHADTVLAHPVSYVIRNGISASVVVPESFLYNDSDGHSVLGVPTFAATSSIMLFIGTSSCTIGMTDGVEEQFCDNIWNYTGPFQSRYKGVQLLQNPNYKMPFIGYPRVSRSFTANQTLHRNGLNYTASCMGVSILAYTTRSGGANAVPTQLTIMVDSALSGTSTTKLTEEFVPAPYNNIPFMTTNVLYSGFFGFGDGPHHFPKGHYEVGLAASITYQFNYVPLVRGWKYGIFDAQPRYSKAIYRYGQYGQFRDMLEQRPYTKFYANNTFLGAAVQVSFTTESAAYTLARDYVTATNPDYDPRDSGFWDYEYRCGHPFTDIEPTD